MNALDYLRASDPLISDDILGDEAIKARVRAAATSRDVRPPTHSRLRLAVVVGLCALALPLAAFGGMFDSIIGFSNNGVPANTSTFDLRLATALSNVGAHEVRLLARRDGLVFYAARSHAGALCLFDGTSDQPAPDFNEMWCLNQEVVGHFPSALNPVLDYSWLPRSAGGSGDPAVAQLKGFAADGVSVVQLIAADGSVIASAAVEGNVYASQSLPSGTTGMSIVARDHDGRTVWTEDLTDNG